MQKVSFVLSAKDLYQKGQAENLRLDAAGRAIVLTDWGMVEDDADGVGFPYSQDILSGATRIKKELVLDPAEANAARLLIYHAVEELWKTPAYEARVTIDVNGHSLEATLKTGWNTVPVDPAFLVRGKNEVVLWTPAGGKPAAIVPIADRNSILAAAPWRLAASPRSFKSTDGGKTWSPRLGKGSDVPGEYMVRLHLRRHLPMGTYASPVMDLTDVDRRQVVKPLSAVRSVVARIRQDSPAGTSATCLIRTGQTPVFQAAAWEDWRKFSDGARLGAKGRYFQVRLDLTTDDLLKTPSLAEVSFDVEVEPLTTEGAGRMQVLEYKAYPVIRSSLPFEYESLNHPSLKALREQYRLDEVVKGATTQMERVIRLNHWISTQWNWHAPEDVYPAWNALDILKKKPGGESQGGFCGQYAIAMTQCCLALGIQARYVFAGLPGVVGGHEVAEFWSDEEGKWVLMDTNMDRYYLDPNTRAPMNAMEIHRAILRYYFDGDKIGDDAHNKARFDAKGLEGFLKQGPQAQHGGNNAGPNWFDPVKAHLMWGHPHMMRRNDFFSKPQPLPKQHGFGIPWSWNGYYHWFDAQSPREELFTGYTDRECDYYWNLNQVDLVLEQTPEPGVLAVSAETNTPDLQAMLVSINGGPWAPTAETFAWRLKEGENTLQVKVRNTAGVEGKPSVARVSWSAK